MTPTKPTKYPKSLNMVMIACQVKGETVIRLLDKDVIDILCEPRNAKQYGSVWACVCAKDKVEARAVWQAHLAKPTPLVFGTVILPERLR